jgi:hypothetical protein
LAAWEAKSRACAPSPPRHTHAKTGSPFFLSNPPPPSRTRILSPNEPQDTHKKNMPARRPMTTSAVLRLLVTVLAASAAVAVAAATTTSASPAHGKGGGAVVSGVCGAAKSAWSSTAKCASFKNGICETVQTCEGL